MLKFMELPFIITLLEFFSFTILGEVSWVRCGLSSHDKGSINHMDHITLVKKISEEG